MPERPYRRPYRTSFSSIAPAGKTRRRKRQRQTPFTPLDIHQRDLIKEDAEDLADRLIVHRRGPRRADVAVDFQETRAVSESSVRGSLPERIHYKKNIEYGFYPGSHFTFQSSQDGGRLEVGGMVADFIYPQMRLIVQVQGPTHDQRETQQRDARQHARLVDMGFIVEELDDDIIYDPLKHDMWFRGHILSRPNLGMQRTMVGSVRFSDPATPEERALIQEIGTMLDEAQTMLEGLN